MLKKSSQKPTSTSNSPNSINDMILSGQKDAFNWVDVDGNGEIKPHEIARIFNSFGIKYTQSQLNDIIHEFDKSNTGSINYEGYTELLDQKLSSAEQNAEALDGFNLFNSTKDGKISASQLRHGLANFGEYLTEEESDDILHLADLNNDGHIDFQEYKILISS